MNPTRRFARFRQAGFTLIELMVGMAIGLLATIIIMQVMSLFEAQRRTTTGSADAQTNGGIALYSIAREVQMAGYGLLPITDSALECTTHVTYGATGITGTQPHHHHRRGGGGGRQRAATRSPSATAAP